MQISTNFDTFERPIRTLEVRVPSRFCGPPGSGNGGYTAGLLGKQFGSRAEVTLRRPIPLDEPLEITSDSSHHSVLWHDGFGIAEAHAAELDLDVPRGVSFSHAATARVRFPGYRVHPFPHCFVCGTRRGYDDGMCLFTGPVEEGVVASSWVPSADFGDARGHVAPEVVCAALDCPGAWSLIAQYEITKPIVLGKMTYRIDRSIVAGEPYVVMGWALGRERRKSYCGTAIYDPSGSVCAFARSIWIEIG